MKHIKNIFTIILALAIMLSMSITAFAAESESDEEVDITQLDVYDEVPLMNQKDYPDTAYGPHGTVSTHGCGLVSVAMVATYLKDEWHDPVVLAEQFADYNTPVGSKWTLIKDSAEELGLSLQEQTYDWATVRGALENGQVVIALYGSDSYFTDGGHFVVLTGVNENNLITVNDPYGGNYTRTWVLVEGFKNGFEDHYIRCGGGPFWIYEKKPEKEVIVENANTDVELEEDVENTTETPATELPEMEPVVETDSVAEANDDVRVEEAINFWGMLKKFLRSFQK